MKKKSEREERGKGGKGKGRKGKGRKGRKREKEGEKGEKNMHFLLEHYTQYVFKKMHVFNPTSFIHTG